MSDGGPSAPKKLKLTLKLNSSSSSGSLKSSSLPTSSNPSSPVKPQIADLPSGLANLKGRGRPKVGKKSSGVTTNHPVAPSSSNTPTTTSNTVNSNEYAADLKSLVNLMKSFQPRKWSLTRNFELKNVANYQMALTSGLWSTSQSTSVMTTEEEEEFEGTTCTCQCGKVFNDRSKYRKHVKIHDKATLATNTISLKLKVKPQQPII